MLLADVLGVPVPDGRPLFVAALAVHVVAGGAGTVAGALAAFARKRPGRHPRAGRIYLIAISTVAVTATVMATMRWWHSWHLFGIAVTAVSLAWLGWLARHRAWHRWTSWHGSAMGLSYIGLLTGFYVDNGERLPVWDQLPPVAYWVVPAAIGLPLIIFALARNQALPGWRHRVGTRR